MSTLADLLPPERVVRLESRDKESAISELWGLVSRSRAVTDPAALKQAILAREVLMSTGVGYGVAIPHARIPSVDQFLLALGVSDEGIAYGSVMDDQPVRLICLIVGPESHQGYLALLQTLMKFIKSEKGQIMASRSPDEITRFARAYPLALGGAAAPRTAS